ncbi:MAG: carbohydrate ABC transporter permease [Chloroflexi bacterium]|nr:carbohydrate ABC transporter permease [Chloroflexota bacterium]
MTIKLIAYPGGIGRARLIENAVWYIGLSVAALVFFFPFFWTVSSSLKHPSELFSFPPLMLPAVPQWHNYARVFEKVPFMLWTRNTVYLVALGTVGRILSASMAAFAFARSQFRGKDLFFLITLSTMMLPAQVTLIPQFVLFHKLGWINTLKPMWVPAWFGGGAFAIFLMRQFMMTIPRELDESAFIDGASSFRIFWSIILPLCPAALATLAVISMIGQWNAFIEPLIYIRSERLLTIAVGLNYLKNQPELGGLPMQHLLMAASVMSTAPLVILFFAAQKYFVQGIALTGIKG